MRLIHVCKQHVLIKIKAINIFIICVWSLSPELNIYLYIHTHILEIEPGMLYH